ncbi:MAG: hypothetical protein WB542_12585, partial [Polaromonas sp.]
LSHSPQNTLRASRHVTPGETSIGCAPGTGELMKIEALNHSTRWQDGADSVASGPDTRGACVAMRTLAGVS